MCGSEGAFLETAFRQHEVDDGRLCGWCSVVVNSYTDGIILLSTLVGCELPVLAAALAVIRIVCAAVKQPFEKVRQPRCAGRLLPRSAR